MVMVGGSTRITAKCSARWVNISARAADQPRPGQGRGAGGRDAGQRARRQPVREVTTGCCSTSFRCRSAWTMGWPDREGSILRNSTIPVARGQEFTTFKDGQTAMAFQVLAGRARTGRRLPFAGALRVARNPADGGGCRAIRVTFQVDADGLLSVSARAAIFRRRGQRWSSLPRTERLEIAEMLLGRDSFKNAGDDTLPRKLREQQVEAERSSSKPPAGARARMAICSTASRRWRSIRNVIARQLSGRAAKRG